MTETPLLKPPSLYQDDETAWLEHTSRLVAERRFEELDLDNLSEYLADMAKRDKREVLSRLEVLLIHLLKWEHQPARRSSSWRSTIMGQRNKLNDLLDSATLLNHARQVLPQAFDRAVKRAAAETKLTEGHFPTACPYSLDELLDEG